MDRSAGRVRGLSGAADGARAAQKRGPGGSGAPSSSIARTVRVDHAEDGDVDPRVGRSASAKRPARWFGIHERSMIEPVVARSGPMGTHERLQVGSIGLGKACAREVGSVWCAPLCGACFRARAYAEPHAARWRTRQRLVQPRPQGSRDSLQLCRCDRPWVCHPQSVNLAGSFSGDDSLRFGATASRAPKSIACEARSARRYVDARRRPTPPRADLHGGGRGLVERTGAANTKAARG